MSDEHNIIKEELEDKSRFRDDRPIYFKGQRLILAVINAPRVIEMTFNGKEFEFLEEGKRT